jgi:hypothetical protein
VLAHGREFLNMHKVSQKQRFMLMLPGLVLLAAFLIGGGVEALLGKTSAALAAEARGTERVADKLARRFSTDCSEEHRGPSFNSAIVVADEEVVCGDLTSFGGSVVIHGVVEGDVVTFGGNVVIDGVVNGNVTLYGGNLTLQDDAHVNGDIHVCGGIWTQGSDSRLHGSAFSCTKSLGKLLASVSGANIRFWSTLVWIMLGMLLTSLLPEHVMLIRTTVKSKMGRSFVLGLLSVLLAPAILAVLIGLIISIPLAIVIAVGLIAAWALGIVAVGWIVGDYIVRSVFPQHCTSFVQIIVGMIVLAVAGSLPSIGLWITIGSGLVGLGAVLLSRFGTRLYSPPRHPLPL